MLFDEDPFPLVASVNIAATNWRAVLNENEDEKFSSNAKIRKVWILKQYLVYKDELTVKGKVSIAREKENNGRYRYHSKQEIKKEKPFKEKNVPPKEKHKFPEGKGMNTSKRKKKVYCKYHNSKNDAKTKSYGKKKKLLKEIP